jgi:hypothetical protein
VVKSRESQGGDLLVSNTFYENMRNDKQVPYKSFDYRKNSLEIDFDKKVANEINPHKVVSRQMSNRKLVRHTRNKSENVLSTVDVNHHQREDPYEREIN